MFDKIKEAFGIKEKKQASQKIYFHGVSAIKAVPFMEGEEKLIMSGYVPDMVVWLQSNCTYDGWININIVPKKDKTETRSHVAYLNERLTKNEKTDKAEKTDVPA